MMNDFIYNLYTKIILLFFDGATKLGAGRGLNVNINSETVAKFAEIQKEFELWINGFVGLTFLVSIGTFMIHVLKLANAGSNAQKRAQALRDMMITLACTAGVGGLSVIYLIIFYTGF